MTDFADIMTRYLAERETHTARAVQMFADNKAILLPLLESLRVATVELEFGGAADNGQCYEPSLGGRMVLRWTARPSRLRSGHCPIAVR